MSLSLRWFFLSFCLVAFGCWFAYLTIKYSNPYKLIMVFGKKGAGKTTYLTKIAQKYLKMGRPVYSTEFIAGTYKIDPSDVGFVKFPEGSVLLLDEVGMYYDNRNFKQFKPEVRDYFKLQRHYKHTVYMFSQSFDVDIKIRQLCDSMYLLVNYFGWWTVGKQIRRKIVVVKAGENSESRIADELIISPLLLTPFGARVFVFIPHWTKYFNSHSLPSDLPEKKFPRIDYPDGLWVDKKNRVHKKHRSRRDKV